MTEVYIVGIAMTSLGKFPELSVKDLTKNAVMEAIADADCDLTDIQGAWFSNTRQGIMENQNVIRGQCALRPLGLGGIPITNVENACASGSTAVREALANIRAGMCDVALVAGADKMFFPDKKDLMFKAFLGGTDIHLLENTIAWLNGIQTAKTSGAGQTGTASPHSFFMDYYAAMARMHIDRFGTTELLICAES